MQCILGIKLDLVQDLTFLLKRNMEGKICTVPGEDNSFARIKVEASILVNNRITIASTN